MTLNAEQLSELLQLSKSRTAPVREVQRAQILCRYHAGETIAGIARALEMTRKSASRPASEARSTTPLAVSFGVPIRPIGRRSMTLAAQARRYTRFAVPLNNAAFSAAEKLAANRLNAFHTTP